MRLGPVRHPARLRVAAEVIPGAPKVLPIPCFCPARFVICENDMPLLIPVNDEREALQEPQCQDQLPFPRCRVAHRLPSSQPCTIGTPRPSFKASMDIWSRVAPAEFANC